MSRRIRQSLPEHHPDKQRGKVSGRFDWNSIQVRLTATAFLFILGTAAAMGVAGFKFTATFEQDRFQDHYKLLVSYLAKSAELGLLLGNEQQLQRLSLNMLAVSNVQLVEVYDRNDKLVVRRERERPLPEMNFVSAEVTSSSLSTAENPYLETDQIEEQLGRVTIGYSLSDLSLLEEKMAVGFALLAVGVAIVPAIVYWRLSKAIRAPLQDVLLVAQEVSHGQLDVRAHGGTLTETSTLANAFNDMLDALQQQRVQLDEANDIVSRQKVLAEVGKFSMMMAHEIKNPLAIIHGSLGVLRKKEPVSPAVKSQMLGFVDEEIARVNRLVEDFLLFARPRPPAFQSMTSHQLLERVKQRILLMDTNIRFLNDLDPPFLSCEIEIDMALMERALLNLVRNAMDAASSPSAVEVNVTCNDTELIFSVLDDGSGIKPEHLEKIFEPFFSDKAKGTGLGLAIAKEAVHAHRGMLVARNNSGAGACFKLHLPFEDDLKQCVLNGSV